MHPFVVPSSWEIALNDIACPEDTRSYIVKGPKNSGKSTFARTLVNRLLESYVDFPMLHFVWFNLVQVINV